VDHESSDHTRNLRLDDLVADHEKRVTDLRARLLAGEIPEAVYHEHLYRERNHLVALILKTYEDNSRLGPGFYENLVYTTYRSLIDIDDGVQRAMTRIHSDVRDVNNAHGEHVAHFDFDGLTNTMNAMTEILLVKTLMTGIGLHEERDRTVNEIIQKKFGSRREPVTRDITPPNRGQKP
jgi:hypothetical protein